jgi:hypothetical protein
MIPRQWREQYPLRSRVSSNERIIFETDDDWWFRNDIIFLRQPFETFPFNLETDEMKRFWAELGEIVGNRQVEGRRIVSLILANRR